MGEESTEAQMEGAWMEMEHPEAGLWAMEPTAAQLVEAAVSVP